MKKLFGILTLLFVLGILFSSCTRQEVVPVKDWDFEELDLRGDELDDPNIDGEDPDDSVDGGGDPEDEDDDGDGSITDDDDDEDEDDGGAARNADGG